MARTAAADPTIVRFRRALNEMYGDRIDRVVLFGLRSRGDSRTSSDYDVAVFLHDMHDRSAEMDRLAALGANIVSRTGEVVHGAGAYTELTPLMLGIRTDGIDL
jgi:uncharacterized protein